MPESVMRFSRGKETVGGKLYSLDLDLKFICRVVWGLYKAWSSVKLMGTLILEGQYGNVEN